MEVCKDFVFIFQIFIWNPWNLNSINKKIPKFKLNTQIYIFHLNL